MEIITLVKNKHKVTWNEIYKLTGANSQKEAAAVVGISRQALDKWTKSGMSKKNYEKYFGRENEKN